MPESWLSGKTSVKRTINPVRVISRKWKKDGKTEEYKNVQNCSFLLSKILLIQNLLSLISVRDITHLPAEQQTCQRYSLIYQAAMPSVTPFKFLWMCLHLPGFSQTFLANGSVPFVFLLLQLLLQAPDSPQVSKQNWRQHWMQLIEFILGS